MSQSAAAATPRHPENSGDNNNFPKTLVCDTVTHTRHHTHRVTRTQFIHLDRARPFVQLVLVPRRGRRHHLFACSPPVLHLDLLSDLFTTHTARARGCLAYPARPRTSTSGSSSTAVCAIWNSSKNLGHCPRCPFGSRSAAMSSATPISVSTCDRSCELRVLTQPGWYRCRSKLCRLWESRDPASAFAKRGEQLLLRCRHGV